MLCNYASKHSVDAATSQRHAVSDEHGLHLEAACLIIVGSRALATQMQAVLVQAQVVAWDRWIINVADSNHGSEGYNSILKKACRQESGALMRLLALSVMWVGHVGHVVAFTRFKDFMDVRLAERDAKRVCCTCALCMSANR